MLGLSEEKYACHWGQEMLKMFKGKKINSLKTSLGENGVTHGKISKFKSELSSGFLGPWVHEVHKNVPTNQSWLLSAFNYFSTDVKLKILLASALLR